MDPEAIRHLEQVARAISEGFARGTVPETEAECLMRLAHDKPGDLEARLRAFVACAWQKRVDELVPHLCHLIRECPQCDAIVYAIDPGDHPKGFQTVRNAWLEAVAHSSDPLVAFNAFSSLYRHSFEDGQRLLNAALAQSPHGQRWLILGGRMFYQRGLSARSPDLIQKAAALFNEAVQSVEADQDCHPVLRNTRLNAVLYQAAWASFDAGNLEDAEGTSLKCVVATGFDAQAVRHHGHTILGLIALGRGVIPDAEAHLSASVHEAAESVYLKTRGPAFRLARRLLLAGRPDVVLQFLSAVPGLWPDGSDTVLDWKRQIEDGRQPAMKGAEFEPPD